MELTIKKWGRSFGVIIPMGVVKQFNLKENDSISASLFPKKTPMESTFGSLKMKRSTREILAESDKEGWDE